MDDVLDLTPSADAPAEERVVLFRIGATEYDVPAAPELGIAVRYLTRVLRGGGLLAEMALLEDLLAPEAYQVLLDQKVPQEALQALVSKAEGIVLGPLERRPDQPPTGS